MTNITRYCELRRKHGDADIIAIPAHQFVPNTMNEWLIVCYRIGEAGGPHKSHRIESPGQRAQNYRKKIGLRARHQNIESYRLGEWQYLIYEKHETHSDERMLQSQNIRLGRRRRTKVKQRWITYVAK